MGKISVSGSNDQIGLESLFEYSVEGIIVVDNMGTIVKVNPSAGRMFGYENEGLLGKKIEELIPPRFAPQHISHRENFSKSPHSRSMGSGMDLFAKRKDNSEFPVEVSLSPLHTKEGNEFVLAYVIDVSMRKGQEEILKKAHTDLKHSAEALIVSNTELENFAYIASHDLQEPLRKIQSFGERLRIIEGEKLSADGKDYLDRMQNAAERMQNLIANLLQYSRLSKKEDDFEQVNLNKILFQVLDDLEIAIENSNAQFEIDELPIIEGSPFQLSQLFQNLISNAIKFRKEGEAPYIKISFQKKVKPVAFEEVIEIHVEDNGIGFNEKYTDKIFNIFQRLEGKKYEGSGIGLATCKKISLKHGGGIVAESTIGKGSKFIVTLKTKHN